MPVYLACIIHKKWKTIYKQENISVLFIMLRKFYFSIFFPSAPIFGHLLRGENLEAGFARKNRKILKSIG
jgi:hypothetical protein